jgi:hypothetical protein
MPARRRPDRPLACEASLLPKAPNADKANAESMNVISVSKPRLRQSNYISILPLLACNRSSPTKPSKMLAGNLSRSDAVHRVKRHDG